MVSGDAFVSPHCTIYPFKRLYLPIQLLLFYICCCTIMYRSCIIYQCCSSHVLFDAILNYVPICHCFLCTYLRFLQSSIHLPCNYSLNIRDSAALHKKPNRIKSQVNNHTKSDSLTRVSNTLYAKLKSESHTKSNTQITKLEYETF